MAPEAPRWRKSTYSGNPETNCVEVAGALVRDSKNVAGPVLSFSDSGWRRFLTSLKARRTSRLP